jgi:hypothetical protein
MAIIAELPREVAHVVLHYIALFRPASGRSVTPAKAQRLLGGLKELVDRRLVQVPGQVARPCLPSMWGQAIEEMLDRRDRLTLPLKNHNYLRQVAWPIADKADATREVRRNRDEATGNFTRPGEDGEDVQRLDIKSHLNEFKKNNPRFADENQA